MRSHLLLFIFLSFFGLLYSDVYKIYPIVDGSVVAGSAEVIYLTVKYDRKDLFYKDQKIEGFSTDRMNFLDKTATDNWSMKSSNISDYLLTGMALSPFLLYSSRDIRDDKGDIGVLYLEAVMVNGAITQMIKNTVKRKRPYLYNEEVPYSQKMQTDAYRSFISGHTSTVFMSAVFTIRVLKDYNINHDTRQYVQTALLSTAILTGYLRYQAGKHFPTDIIAGSIIGSAVGYAIPEIHKKNNEKNNIRLYPLRIGLNF